MKMTERWVKQLDYSIALQRAIEYHCRGSRVPAWIAKSCPHHAQKLNADLESALKRDDFDFRKRCQMSGLIN